MSTAFKMMKRCRLVHFQSRQWTSLQPSGFAPCGTTLHDEDTLDADRVSGSLPRELQGGCRMALCCRVTQRSRRGHTEVTQGSGEDGGAEQVADIWSDEEVNDEAQFWVSGHDGAAGWDAC